MHGRRLDHWDRECDCMDLTTSQAYSMEQRCACNAVRNHAHGAAEGGVLLVCSACWRGESARAMSAIPRAALHTHQVFAHGALKAPMISGQGTALMRYVGVAPLSGGRPDAGARVAGSWRRRTR